MSFAWIREPGKESRVFSLFESPVGDFYFSQFDGRLIQLLITDIILKNCSKWVSEKLISNALPNIYPKDSHNYDDFLQVVSQASEVCSNGVLEKVVLSRTKAHKLTSVSPTNVFERLCREYPLATIYLISIDGNSLWMGATPECLLELNGKHLKTMSLAATRPVNSEGRWGIKEREEQHLVTRDIVHMLDALGCKKISVDGPKILTAGPVEHLCSSIEAVRPMGAAITMIKSLHPTPAVGGLPRAQSMAFILQHENYNRSFYSGYFGWNNDERSIFYVNLRCMEIGRDGLICYAGAGITSKSNAKDEWVETEEKLKTLERVIVG
jgi:isochorismate synthase|tara:strand:+ start:2353 stop:3324 length:972 start_codon:yes stop_codon:yes gene_type:complete